MELSGNNQFFGLGVDLRPGVREFNPGGGGLEPDLAYRVFISKIEGTQNPGKAPQFVFRAIVKEPGFEGVERSIYVDIPQPLNPNEADKKKLKALEIDHDVMLTTIISLGYTPQQALQIAAQRSVPYGTIFMQAPGQGTGFVFARTWERKKKDTATNTFVTNPVTGEAETEERIVLDFCTPDHYQKHSASGRAAREAAAKNAGGAPSYNAPAQPPQYGAQPAYGAPPAAPAYGAPQPTAQPSWGAPQPPPGASVVPTGYGVPPAPPQPNGQWGAPAAAPGQIMNTMQTPRA